MEFISGIQQRHPSGSVYEYSWHLLVLFGGAVKIMIVLMSQVRNASVDRALIH